MSRTSNKMIHRAVPRPNGHLDRWIVVAGVLFLSGGPAPAAQPPSLHSPTAAPPNSRPPGCSNEPPGLSPLSDQPWDEVPPRWRDGRDAYGWSVSGGYGQLRVEQDPAAPASPPNVLVGRFPKGMKGGGGPFHIEITTRVASQFYQCFWLNLGDGFTNNGNAGTKLAFVLSAQRQRGQGGSQYYLTLFGGKEDRGNMGLNIEAPGAELNREMHSRFTWRGRLGTWHKFEVLTTVNTQGQANGSVRYWVDGDLDFQFDNVKWFPDRMASEGWNFVDITPTYGGGHNPVPQPLFLRIDHWYISGR